MLQITEKEVAELLDDVPELEENNLRESLRHFAGRLAAILPHLPASSPILINGNWGAGKTTLLRAVQQRLKDPDSAPQVATVWFEAWRYEGEEALLPALIRRIWDEAPEEVKKEEGWRALCDALVDTAISLSFRALPLALTALGLPTAGGAAKGLSPSALNKDFEALAAPDREPPANPTDLLWQRFQMLLKRAWPNDNGVEKRVVVFIDDLDRCSPEGALMLLDALRTLVLQPVPDGTKPRCVFVLALDKHVLAEAVARKFAPLAAYEGSRYLEKIFPVTFDLPTPREADVGFLIQQFLKNFPADESGDHRDVLQQILAQPLFANPRLMKRCIHRFSLVNYFESNAPKELTETDFEPGRSEAIRDHTLACWIAAGELWPTLRRLFTLQDDTFWRRFGEVLREPSPSADSFPDPACVELLRQPGIKGWLLAENFTRDPKLAAFREADRRLKRWGL